MEGFSGNGIKDGIACQETFCMPGYGEYCCLEIDTLSVTASPVYLGGMN